VAGRALEPGYGAAWLSPEFAGQREGQVVGIVQLGARF
jgi:hypothetical protein